MLYLCTVTQEVMEPQISIPYLGSSVELFYIWVYYLTMCTAFMYFIYNYMHQNDFSISASRKVIRLCSLQIEYFIN